MRWFDKLLGSSEPLEPPKETKEVKEQNPSHEDIYRRPKGKFRFPIDVGQLSDQDEVILHKDEHTFYNEQATVRDYESRRARRNKRLQIEGVEPSRKQSHLTKKKATIMDSQLSVNQSIHRPKFTASSVPSAIFGTRKHLKESDKKVVMTPLISKKSESIQPSTPTYRKEDNMVNVENVYASQIVEEIRQERKRKVERKKQFELERIEKQARGVEAEQLNLDEDNIEVTFVENELDSSVKKFSDSNDYENNERLAHDEECEDAIDVEYVELHSEMLSEPLNVEEIELNGILDDEKVSEVHNDTKQDEKSVFNEVAPVRSSRPFNVLMTPSDKKKLMNKKTTVKINSEVHTEEATGKRSQDTIVESTAQLAAQSNGVEQNKQIEKRKGPKYLLPPVSLLMPPEPSLEDDAWVSEQRAQLDDAFYHFNVPAQVEDVVVGPSVTRYELSVEKGVKVSRITNLQDDIKMALAAKEIRIEAPIPGTSRVGVEVPNQETRKVNVSEVIFNKRFKFAESKLMVALGVKINNEPMLMDIAKMPHALIAGATGSGKSVSINAILVSLLYRNNPNELKLLLIDPKMVELAPYNDLPHLIAPVITDVKAATESLKWIVKEMDRRYKSFANVHVRNITAYNQKVSFDKRLPKIVVVIDELADLMMMAPQEVEHSIARIAQKARAAGIHLILATQRPSVNVITGLIKANVPTRIAFMVSSSIDSRTILDYGGAEKLLGNGDMLYQGNGMNKPIRIQGCYISDEEIDGVVAYVKSQGDPHYLFEEKQLLEKVNEVPKDDLFDEVVSFMNEEGQISTSQLQRRFQIGYNRAARIIDHLESLGLISGPNGSKPRTVIMSDNLNEE